MKARTGALGEIGAPALVFGGGEIDLSRLREHPHGAVPQYS
jgi:hypothetical protein